VTGRRRALLVFALAVAAQVPWLAWLVVMSRPRPWTVFLGTVLMVVGSPLLIPLSVLGWWPRIRSVGLGVSTVALAGVAFWFAVGLIYWFRGTGESD
jgi:hypothetical protein